jgi:hypothetical protein
MKPSKYNLNETLDLYQSWNFIPASIILVILISIPLHHGIEYLELLIPEWYMSLENILVSVSIWYFILRQTYIVLPDWIWQQTVK